MRGIEESVGRDPRVRLGTELCPEFRGSCGMQTEEAPEAAPRGKRAWRQPAPFATVVAVSNAEPDWSLYLVRCGDGALYTGIATDVERRLAEHAAGKGAKYLRGRGPLSLAFERSVGDRGAALRMEYAIKQLSRERKEALVSGRLAWETIRPR